MECSCTIFPSLNDATLRSISIMIPPRTTRCCPQQILLSESNLWSKSPMKCDMWCMRWSRHFEFSFCVCASDLLYFCPKYLSLDPSKRPQWKVDANTCRHFFKNDTWACNLFLARCCSDSRSACTHSCITQLRVYIYFLFLKITFGF